ncbi:hypothetical protein OG819_53050 [Streptomyces sp. NBC_01549]|uniref:hypothetical protein n=1 Tax=Streptomyces sp. NBC_01549 TaxID=2975874 RepID=UPI00225805CF|nr:hypothetical protein [Streptomyces sp. NBC_01549]MCX4597946.1 hypothetical protein [Streptomyces sp. NBC_01549]
MPGALLGAGLGKGGSVRLLRRRGGQEAIDATALLHLLLGPVVPLTPPVKHGLEELAARMRLTPSWIRQVLNGKKPGVEEAA